VNDIIKVNTITEAHKIFGLGKPRHPLVSVYRHEDISLADIPAGLRFSVELYHIMLKKGCSGSLVYGRNSYDFEDGTMAFTGPGQVMSSTGDHEIESATGWSIIFHPDLIRRSELGRNINNYGFFSYDVHEALHLSEEERLTVTELAAKIEKEYQQNIDKHSQKLIISNIELILDYCTRYYDRQFYTRTNLNKDIVSRFEHLLKDYFESGRSLEEGLPTVKFCGTELNMSPNYLSDMLKKETGRNAQEHIHFYMIEKAKTLLLNSGESISQIAYSLGFEYPQHFSKIFKAKTGMSPVEYRSMN
jgi:AraC-like DNA-binding protein